MVSGCKKLFGCNCNLYFQESAASPDKTLMNEIEEMEDSSKEKKKERNSQDRIVKI